LRVKWVALLGGPLGILLSVGLGVGAGALLGWPYLQGMIVGIVVSVASTMVLARLLMDSGELHSRHGRIMIGISLVEDLAVVILIVLIPAFGALEPGRLLAIAAALGKAALVLVPFAYLAAKVVPPVMTRVARTQNDELFLLVALAIGLGTAALTEAVGLSLALGAFLAGLLISGSDYAHEALARVLPVRDAFVALFFVTIGTLIDPALIMGNLPLLGTMIALVVVGKLVLRTLVVRIVISDVARRTRFWCGSFRDGSPACRRTRRGAALALRGEPLQQHVVLCGFSRVGSAIGEALQTFGVPYVVIERDPDIVKSLRTRGVPCLFGDAGGRGLLEAAGVRAASLAIVALPEIDRARLVVRHAREMNDHVSILARAHHPADGEGLARAGASEVIHPELEAAATLIRHALKRLALPRERVLAYLDRFRGAMELAAREERLAPDTLPRVAEVVLGQGTLADQSPSEARIRERLGVTVVAVTRGGGDVVLNPPAETLVRAGDRVRIFGLPDQIDAFRLEAHNARPTS
jgi:CPA2 family monovalent cation:H+ antiporter-2